MLDLDFKDTGYVSSRPFFFLSRGKKIQCKQDEENRHGHTEQNTDEGLTDEVEAESFEHKKRKVMDGDHAEGITQEPGEA